MTDHGDARSILCVILGSESAAEGGLHAKSCKKSGIANGGIEILWQAAIGGRKAGTPVAIESHLFETVGLLLPIVEVGAGGDVERRCSDDVAFIKTDQAIGITIRQRCEKNGADHREYCRISANP